MVIGKLFRTILAVSFLVPAMALAQGTPRDSVTGPMVSSNNWFGFLNNFMVYRGGLLDNDDRKIYRQALMIMLDNVPNGEVMQWSSERNQDVKGQMRVVHGYQTSNGYCRVYQSEIRNGNKMNSWQEMACITNDEPQWQFYNK